MSKPMLDSLDYASKMSRAPEHIHKLMEDGARQARRLLENLSVPALTCEEMGRLLTGLGPPTAGIVVPGDTPRPPEAGQAHA
jgi:hypothetical protein